MASGMRELRSRTGSALNGPCHSERSGVLDGGLQTEKNVLISHRFDDLRDVSNLPAHHWLPHSVSVAEAVRTCCVNVPEARAVPKLLFSRLEV
jgi:hypothetical protein